MNVSPSLYPEFFFKKIEKNRLFSFSATVGIIDQKSHILVKSREYGTFGQVKILKFMCLDPSIFTKNPKNDLFFARVARDLCFEKIEKIFFKMIIYHSNYEKNVDFVQFFSKKWAFLDHFYKKMCFFVVKKQDVRRWQRFFEYHFFIIFSRHKSFSRGNLRNIDFFFIFWLIGIYFFYAKNQKYSRKTNLRFFIFFRFEKHWTKSTFFMGPKNDPINRKYATIDVFSISLITTRSKVNLFFFKIFYWKNGFKKTQFVFPLHS